MAAFESWRDYYAFAHFVRRKARHIFDEKTQRFISAVVETTHSRVAEHKRGDILWRSQLAFDWEEQTIRDEEENVIDTIAFPIPARRDRMVPWTDRAPEGRINPKGIPCLYLSTDRDTAMAEVRPGIGSYVSVAQFVVLRALRLVDCSSDTEREYSAAEVFRPRKVTPERLEKQAWYDINQAFSEPVTRTDDVADYAPTQVLAEAFRSAGFQGIVYGSRLGPGKTVAIFDVSAADLINCEIHQVEAVDFKFKNAGNPYFVPKYYPSSRAFSLPEEPTASPGSSNTVVEEMPIPPSSPSGA